MVVFKSGVYNSAGVPVAGGGYGLQNETPKGVVVRFATPHPRYGNSWTVSSYYYPAAKAAVELLPAATAAGSSVYTAEQASTSAEQALAVAREANWAAAKAAVAEAVADTAPCDLTFGELDCHLQFSDDEDDLLLVWAAAVAASAAVPEPDWSGLPETAELLRTRARLGRAKRAQSRAKTAFEAAKTAAIADEEQRREALLEVIDLLGEAVPADREVWWADRRSPAVWDRFLSQQAEWMRNGAHYSVGSTATFLLEVIERAVVDGHLAADHPAVARLREIAPE